MWKIKTTQLYPEIWTEDVCYGWPLSMRQAAIQLPANMLRVSHLIHEHTHGVVEAYKTYFPEAKGLVEPGHGPLFCGVMAYNLSRIMSKKYLDIVEDLHYYSLRVLEIETVLKFKKIFRG